MLGGGTGQDHAMQAMVLERPGTPLRAMRLPKTADAQAFALALSCADWKSVV